jgi:hypothetical protein
MQHTRVYISISCHSSLHSQGAVQASKHMHSGHRVRVVVVLALGGQLQRSAMYYYDTQLTTCNSQGALQASKHTQSVHLRVQVAVVA